MQNHQGDDDDEDPLRGEPSRWAAKKVEESMRSQGSSQHSIDLLWHLHAIGVNGGAGGAGGAGTKRRASGPPGGERRARIPRRTEEPLAPFLLSLPTEMLQPILLEILSITHIFHAAHRRVSDPENPDITGGLAGGYEKTIMRLARHQMHVLGELRLMGRRVNAILNHTLFRQYLYREWYAMDLMLRAKSKSDIQGDAIKTLAIPPPPNPRQTAAAGWYKTLIYNAMLADHLTRVVTVASGLYMIEPALQDDVMAFYSRFVGKIGRTGSRSRESAVFGRGLTMEEQTEKALSILNPSEHSGLFVPREDREDFDTPLYIDMHRNMNAFVPGAMELAFEDHFILISSAINPTFPGAEWLAMAFGSSVPWYMRKNEIPELQYYAALRNAMFPGRAGADVFRVPYLTFDRARGSPVWFTASPITHIEGDGYHVFYPDLYGETTTTTVGPQRPRETAPLIMTPAIQAPVLDHMKFNLRFLRFVDSFICLRWLHDTLHYSVTDSRQRDAENRPATIIVDSVYNWVHRGMAETPELLNLALKLDGDFLDDIDYHLKKPTVRIWPSQREIDEENIPLEIVPRHMQRSSMVWRLVHGVRVNAKTFRRIAAPPQT